MLYPRGTSRDESPAAGEASKCHAPASIRKPAWPETRSSDSPNGRSPTRSCFYVAFEALLDPEHLPGQRRPVLERPYREGLGIDEAVHPLTIRAPLRLVVPWKYGFKSIKSIVRIRLTRTPPPTTWNIVAPQEYGFYANVNPAVDHPRWSQKRERRIGEFRKRPTLPFNGYADEVASLYSGMDLRKLF